MPISSNLPLMILVATMCALSLTALRARGKSSVDDDGTITHRLHFKIEYLNVTRLCKTKQLVSVNKQFPGPTVYVHQGDHVLVRVSNEVDQNVTIHWHGVRQLYTNWADGPAYITQCPIQPGSHYTHNFTVARDTGTLFWHAHISWLRATLYGAFIILPKKGVPYPFPKQPVSEFPILLGEWWTMDVEDVEKYGLLDGAGYNISNAITINGQPGFLYNCSSADTTTLIVTKGETYLLRLINAAMNFNMFFAVANHQLTVVETDSIFTKPYTTEVIVLAPGQTADVLLTADQAVGEYAMGAIIFSPAPPSLVPYPNVTGTAILRYNGAVAKPDPSILSLPSFPATDDSAYAIAQFSSLRSLNSQEYASQVPLSVGRSFLFTVGYHVVECPVGRVCHGPPPEAGYPQGLVGTDFSNITFVTPSVPILQAYYQRSRNTSNDLDALPAAWETNASLTAAYEAYQEDFPSMPLFQYNYTGVNSADKLPQFGTKVVKVELYTNVQLVLQNTRTLFFEAHPVHLHGYNFYVVGMGLGNYNSSTDLQSFNLVDPPSRNTVSVPAGGWAAIRFYADNPGAWLMHCHFEMHTSWGMQMVWIVKEGNSPNEKLPPPPEDYPKC